MFIEENEVAIIVIAVVAIFVILMIIGPEDDEPLTLNDIESIYYIDLRN